MLTKYRKALQDLYRISATNEKFKPLLDEVYFTWIAGLNVFYPSDTGRSQFIAEVIQQYATLGGSANELPPFVTSILAKITEQPQSSVLVLPIQAIERKVLKDKAKDADKPKTETKLDKSTASVPETQDNTHEDVMIHPKDSFLLSTMIQYLWDKTNFYVSQVLESPSVESNADCSSLYYVSPSILQFVQRFQRDLIRRVYSIQTINSKSNIHQYVNLLSIFMLMIVRFLSEYWTLLLGQSLAFLSKLLNSVVPKLSPDGLTHVDWIIQHVSPIGMLVTSLVTFFGVLPFPEAVSTQLGEFAILLENYSTKFTEENPAKSQKLKKVTRVMTYEETAYEYSLIPI